MYYVYRFLKDGKTIYVGQTREFHERILAHLRKGKIGEFDSIEYIKTDSIENALNLEGFFINKLCPTLNIRKEYFNETAIIDKNPKWEVCNNLNIYLQYLHKNTPKDTNNTSTNCCKTCDYRRIINEYKETIGWMEEEMKIKNEQIRVLMETINTLSSII